MYFIVALRQSGLFQFQAAIHEDFPSFPERLALKRHAETLCTSRYIHLQNINAASQRICVFRMILSTKGKYLRIQQ